MLFVCLFFFFFFLPEWKKAKFFVFSTSIKQDIYIGHLDDKSTLVIFITITKVLLTE